MNFNKIKELQKVNNFYLKNDEFVIWDNEGIKINDQTIKLDHPNEVYSFENSFVIIMDDFSKSRFINLKLGQDKISKKINSVLKFIVETTIFQSFWNEDYTELKLSVRNLISEEIIWEIKQSYTPQLIFKEYYFANGINDILRVQKNGNPITWSFSLSQLPSIPHKEFMNPDAPWEIKKFIGVLDNKLWVAMNHRTIIALNCETGELVHTISEILGFDMEWIHNSIPVPEATQIVAEESILLGMGSTSIWKIDAMSGEISIKSYESLFNENRIKNYRNEFIIDGELLFFLSDQDPKIGCFNWKTEKLEWQYAFEKTSTGEFPRLTEIQGNRNKLGVKDLANNLYIFESAAE